MIKTKFVYICNACGEEFDELEYINNHLQNHIIKVRRVIKTKKEVVRT